jgi:hypothetical protein
MTTQQRVERASRGSSALRSGLGDEALARAQLARLGFSESPSLINSVEEGDTHSQSLTPSRRLRIAAENKGGRADARRAERSDRCRA